MIKNYLITVLRNLSQRRLYAAINILGLAVGIACFTVLWLLIDYEWRHDRFHRDAERIFRLTERIEKEGIGEHSSSVPFPVAPTLKESYPGLIEETVRLFDYQIPLFSIRYAQKKRNERKLYFADASFLDVFDYPLVRGNPDTLLQKPFEVLLSAEAARRYFGESQNPIGDTIYFQDVVPLRVSGVFAAEIPPSHIDFDFIVSFSTLDSITPPQFRESWVWNPCWTYVKLNPNVRPEALENVLPEFTEQYITPFIPDKVSLALQPLTSIHLSSHLDYEMQPNSDMRYLYAFGALGVLVLVIAGLNYMQLSISHATLRAKEIAVRKVIGAERTHLIIQFLIESLVLGAIAILMAFILVEQVLPYVITLSGNPLQPNIEGDLSVAQIILSAGLLMAVLAGAYPAYFLSGFEPIRIFSGKRASMPRRQHFNRALVRLQFAIAVALLIFTITNHRQSHFLKAFDLGFRADEVFVVPIAQARAMRKQYGTFRQRLLRDSSVITLTSAEDILGKSHQTRPYLIPKDTGAVFAPSMFVGADFSETLQLEFLAGEPFSLSSAYTSQILINDAMRKQLGFATPEAAIGQSVSTPKNVSYLGDGEKYIQGVVTNFHFTSLHEPMAPFVLEYNSQYYKMVRKFLMLRFRPESEAAARDALRRVWKETMPEQPLEFFKLSDALHEMYEQERILGGISSALTLVALFIATMGLFALSAFVVARREKEIGIRRVLGSSTFSLIVLLNREFFFLILQSTLIGWGVAYLVLYFWFQNFAYHVPPAPDVFLAAAGIVFAVTLLTISFHTVRAALRNPVEAIQRGV